MKSTILILLLSLVQVSVFAQYFFTGEVRDSHGDRLPYVTIKILSSGMLYKTGAGGDFEISSPKADDTITFVSNGYEHYTTVIRSSAFLQVVLKEQSFSQQNRNDGVQSVRSAPASISFAGRSSGISYYTIRHFLDMGFAVPSGAVKVEQLLGHFNMPYEEPPRTEPFHCSSSLVICPWNAAHRLLMVNISGRKMDMSRKPPANLVFLIDVSGSMDMPNKLPLWKACMRSLIRNLRDIDTLSIVQFGARSAVLAGVPGSRKDAMISAIEALQADGPSPGVDGLKLAYRVARYQFIPGGNNRIIFITDGDIDNKQSEARELAAFVAQQRENGVRLSCFGIGVDDSVNVELPMLAGSGQGHYACIGEEEQGEKLLLKELADSGTIAEQVSVTADLDTAVVSDYRLFGFDNKPGADTAARLEGGTVSSGHSLMAVLEIVPKRRDTAVPVARIRVHYRLPGRQEERMVSFDCPDKPQPFEKVAGYWRKAANIALFGMKLQGDDNVGQVKWADVQRMAKAAFTGNSYIEMEYLSLLAKARRVYEGKDERDYRPGR